MTDAEGAVEVVVQQFVGAVRVDQEQVQVAVVVGVEERAIHRVQVAAARQARGRDVFPQAAGRLSPQLIFATTAQVRVDQAVVVEIAPQRRVDPFHCGQRMVGLW
jgi:S-adenosylmethionine hydrolase